MTDVHVQMTISREPDDPLATARVSLGSVGENHEGVYLVFRGAPAAVLELLELAVVAARVALPAGRYTDYRGRPQG